MNVLKFLLSKTFAIQLVIAFIIIVTLGLGLMYYLDVITNHSNEVSVPDLSKMQITEAQKVLEKEGLSLVLLDTVDYKKEIPPLTIVEQDPKGKSAVKNGRKIYVKINAAGYSSVTLPEMEDKTFREISANIRSLGLLEGKKTYRPHIAKDIVLQVSQNGKRLRAGDKVKKNTKIDFILGDGEKRFNGSLSEYSENTEETE